jgi:hypothetical protein
VFFFKTQNKSIYFLFFHPLHTQIKENKRKEQEGIVILSAREIK